MYSMYIVQSISNVLFMYSISFLKARNVEIILLYTLGIYKEVLVSQESCKAETVKTATIKYVHKCLKQVEKLEAEIRKIKKNDEDLGTTLRTKCNDFCNRLDEIEVNEELCEDVVEQLVNLREFLSFSEKKPNKERNLRSIAHCRKYLRGYIFYPKRPSQIPHISCCNRCILSSKVISL